MAVIQGDGQIVQAKGQVALDQRSQVVGALDMRARVRRALENIKCLLASVAGEMGDIVSLVHYATDIQRFMGKDDIRKEFFTAPFSVTTAVQVGRLYHPDLLIEVTAMAENPERAFSSTAGLMQSAFCPS